MTDLSPFSRYSEYDYFLSQFLLSHDDSHLRQAFGLLDLDGDGYVSKEELLNYYKFRDNEADAKFMAGALFRIGDTNRDGYLDENEFVLVATHSMGMQLRPDILTSKLTSPDDKEFQRLLNLFLETHSDLYLEAIFRLIDTNHDGVISRTELRQSYLIRCTPDEDLAADMMLQMGDLNQDGVLSMQEFKELMGQRPSRNE